MNGTWQQKNLSSCPSLLDHYIARDDVERGVDPIAQRAATYSAMMAARGAEITFEQASEKFVEAKAHEWVNAKHTAQWLSTLSNYAFPIVGKLQIRDVTLAHVVKILEPIWTTKTETATRLRGRIENVLDWATVRGYRQGDNPARWKGHLDKILPKPSKVSKVEHHSAVPVVQIGTFVAALRQQNGIAARALEFLALTAARSGEVRGALWSEIDIHSEVWTIPASRMKAGREHRVPLSPSAVSLLNSLPRYDANNIVFVAPRGGILSDMSLTAVMRRMEVDAVPHGFRSSFRDWAAERTNYPREVAEMALAHTIQSKVEAAYRRGDLFEKRARMMRDWADFCNIVTPSGDVIPLNRLKSS